MYYILIFFLFSGAALGMYNSYKKNSNGADNIGKYLCVPCGYIYDPAIGDPDSGIAPGTAFSDIPDDWRCPICGVTKADFIALGGDIQDTSFDCEIVGHTLLNQKQDVLELQLKAPKEYVVQAGQYFSVIYSDGDGDFRRSYSVVKIEANIYTFLIRLGDSSRSASILKSKKIGDTMKIHGIYGNFLYQNTPNKKVFIATGTGLAPLYNMLRSNPRTQQVLVFGVRDMTDMFYLQELENLTGVDAVYIYFSGEEKIPENRGKLHFIKGRFDVCSFLETTKEYKNPDTEFYLCGNPNLVDMCIENLEKLGYTRIFKEKF